MFKKPQEIQRLRRFALAPSGSAPMSARFCVVLADMIGSTAFWSTLLRGSAENLSHGWELISLFQDTIIGAMLGVSDGFFVKGVGDELICRFPSVEQGLEAAIDARDKLITQIAGLDQVKTYLVQTHWAKDKIPPFRFVIHWAEDQLILGLYDISSRQGTHGLRSVKIPTGREKAAVSFPRSPDLFGHHMNYTSRCLGVVSDSAIYLTKLASVRLKEEQRKGMISVGKLGPLSAIEKHLGPPIEVGGSKGIDESLVFQQFSKDSTLFLQPSYYIATVKAYRTKALVYVSDDDIDESRATKIFECAKKVMSTKYTGKRRKDGNPDPIQELLPHLLLCFSTVGLYFQGKVDKKGAIRDGPHETDTKYQVIFRFECLDSERLEKLLLDREGAKTIFNAGRPRSSRVDTNTETRFIRTNEQAVADELPVLKWPSRDEGFRGSFFYAEIDTEDVDDIERYSRRMIFPDLGNQTSADRIKVIELGRLWGSPSIYALVGTTMNNPRVEVVGGFLLKRMANPYGKGERNLAEQGQARGAASLSMRQCGSGVITDVLRI